MPLSDYLRFNKKIRERKIRAWTERRIAIDFVATISKEGIVFMKDTSWGLQNKILGQRFTSLTRFHTGSMIMTSPRWRAFASNNHHFISDLRMFGPFIR
jgi:hypothetical protein